MLEGSDVAGRTPGAETPCVAGLDPLASGNHRTSTGVPRVLSSWAKRVMSGSSAPAATLASVSPHSQVTMGTAPVPATRLSWATSTSVFQSWSTSTSDSGRPRLGSMLGSAASSAAALPEPPHGAAGVSPCPAGSTKAPR